MRKLDLLTNAAPILVDDHFSASDNAIALATVRQRKVLIVRVVAIPLAARRQGQGKQRNGCQQEILHAFDFLHGERIELVHKIRQAAVRLAIAQEDFFPVVHGFLDDQAHATH